MPRFVARPIQTVVMQPRGSTQWLVARIERRGMRVVHVDTIVEAQIVEREWIRGDYSFPGRVTTFHLYPAADQAAHLELEPT